jgi:hypothetical protein
MGIRTPSKKKKKKKISKLTNILKTRNSNIKSNKVKSLLRNLILSQFTNKQIGINIAIKIIKNIDIPSIPIKYSIPNIKLIFVFK